MNDYLIVNLMSDFIYLPYTNKESVIVTSKTVKKNDIICEYNNKKVYSPVSGNAYAYSEIPSIDGITKVVIIENDFKDTTCSSIWTVSALSNRTVWPTSTVISAKIAGADTLVARMTARPAETAWTTPFASIAATVGSLLLQLTFRLLAPAGRTFAASDQSCPFFKRPVGSFTILTLETFVGRPAYGVMVTSQVSFTVGSSTDSTVIIAVPLLPIAVTRPLLSTLTIAGSDEVHFRL